MNVELTGGELALAAFVAGLRVKNVRDRNLRETNGSRFEGALARHTLGALGELAFAKYDNKFWSPVDTSTMFSGDVGSVEVRSVDWEDKPVDKLRRLYIKRDDPDERRFVLAVVRIPTVWLRGWYVARDAKRHDWEEDPQGGRPFFLVPHDRLYSMEGF